MRSREEKIDVDYALEADECFCAEPRCHLVGRKIEHGEEWSNTGGT